MTPPRPSTRAPAPVASRPDRPTGGRGSGAGGWERRRCAMGVGLDTLQKS